VLRLEHAVLQRPGISQRALDPPRRVLLDRDPGAGDELADLPRLRHTVRLDVEVGRQPEVALATCRETDVALDPRDAERADRAPVEVVADHVPDSLVEAK